MASAAPGRLLSAEFGVLLPLRKPRIPRVEKAFLRLGRFYQIRPVVYTEHKIKIPSCHPQPSASVFLPSRSVSG